MLFFRIGCQREWWHTQESMGFSASTGFLSVASCAASSDGPCRWFVWVTTGDLWQKAAHFWRLSQALQRCVCTCLIDNLRLSGKAQVSMAAELLALVTGVPTQGTEVIVHWIFGFCFWNLISLFDSFDNLDSKKPLLWCVRVWMSRKHNF